jgi:hypothetical protein
MLRKTERNDVRHPGSDAKQDAPNRTHFSTLDHLRFSVTNCIASDQWEEDNDRARQMAGKERHPLSAFHSLQKIVWLTIIGRPSSVV